MFSRSTFLHLRFPFSYFLLPIFLFALSISPNLNQNRLAWVFFILHFLLYPASNGYNSYFDKDEKSIGLLKHPPPVNKGLYRTSLLLDAMATLLGFIFINTTFVIMSLLYGLASKAYSHPAVRLKRYPIIGWLTAGFFQGYFTLVMSYVGINDFPLDACLNMKVTLAGALSSLMLLGSYPMTQIYQHEEDSQRGDHTFSIMLGIRGTFYFVMVVFSLATIGFFFYFKEYFSPFYGIVFTIALLPVLIYFFTWFTQVNKELALADYSHTMRLNFISATCLNGFFIYAFLSYTRVLQAPM